jgi:hypothetical protein
LQRTAAVSSFEQILPRKNERAFLAGMTGSGKSVLARYLCSQESSVLIFDAKDEINWKGYKRFTRLAKLIAAREPRAIYAPTFKELDNQDYHDKFFKYAFFRGKVCVYVDELYAVADGNDLPPYYKACLTRGRSKGIKTYTATQRPISIPQWVISEAENKYIFYLQMPQDREKIEKVCGLSVDEQNALDMERHQFFFQTLRFRTGKLTLTGVK